MEIATGQADLARSAYNFDKQFASYWLLGTMFRLLPRPLAPDQVTLASNLVSFALFWGMLCAYLARRPRRVSMAAVLPVLLAPALLTHSAFFATAFVSAGFLLLTVILLEVRPSPGWPARLRWLGVFAAAFCAVGARADAVLALPFLVLLHPRGRSPKSAVKWGAAWIMVLAAGLALALGRTLYRDRPTDYLALFFRPKVFAAYTLFGLGAVALLVPACVASVLECAARLGSRRWTMVLLGLSLLAPFLYYSCQLTSTRYFTLGIVCVLVFVGSRRGVAMLGGLFRAKLARRILQPLLVAGAVLPLAVGVDLPFLNRPALGWRATGFPSSDGVLPMGGYLNYAWQMRWRRGLVDHNHAVWTAAVHTDFRPAADGEVAVLNTPMNSYLLLAARLQGKRPRLFAAGEVQRLPAFYVDSRSLMRRNILDFASRQAERFDAPFLARCGLRPASSFTFDGITVLEGSFAKPASPRGELVLALNSEFGENEYRLTREIPAAPAAPAPGYHLADGDAGKTLVLISRGAFRYVVQSPGQPPAAGEAKATAFGPTGTWFVWKRSGARAGTVVAIDPSPTTPVTVAVSVLPDWMSVSRF